MRNLAIIPARGGSKRIPRKNIRDFLGKPIMAYSIEIAIKSGLFEEVMVSTDDTEIESVAQRFGASVPFYRTGNTANDFATLADVVDEVKASYVNRGLKYDYICCILATAPLITIENIKIGYNIISSQNDCDSVKPIVKYPYPIQRALKKKGDKIEMINPDHFKTRSQDLEDSFYDAGQFYWMHFEKGLRGDQKYGFEISAMDSQDIDTFEDWNIAELKYKYKEKKIDT
jgi:N-acylneuraminate cytidylyltransferase